MPKPREAMVLGEDAKMMLKNEIDNIDQMGIKKPPMRN